MRQILKRSIDTFFKVFGLFLIGAGTALFLAFGVGWRDTAQADLSKYWRTAYDILVQPSQNSPIPKQEGERLLEPNFLSGQDGGITLEQYESIQTIPGVDIAAPIAMIGYFPIDFLATFETDLNNDHLNDPWVAYKDVRTFQISDGKRIFESTDSTYIIQNRRDAYRFDPRLGHIYITPDNQQIPLRKIPLPSVFESDSVRIEGKEFSLDKNGNPYPAVHSKLFELYFPIAGIDPIQENKLIGLEESVLDGRYFKTEEIPWKQAGSTPGGDTWIVPILYNQASFRNINLIYHSYELSIPPDDELPEKLAKGGMTYLENLSQTLVDEQTISLADFYQKEFHNNLNGRIGYNLGGLIWEYIAPAPVRYKAAESKFGFSTVLEAIPSGINTRSPNNSLLLPIEPIFRRHEGRYVDIVSDDGLYGLHFNLRPIGIFEYSLQQEAENQVPMETYDSPLATLLFSEDGEPVPPQTIHPTNNPGSYLSEPPALLTNLAGAKFLAQRDDFISAIRVRVAGVESVGEASQTKIEAVAKEIETITGLQTQITLGSSPQEVLVHIPGYAEAAPLGYISENWVKQFVSIDLQRGFNLADGLLFGSFIIIGAIFVFSETAFSSLKKRRELALYKALGWERKDLFFSVLKEALFHAFLAGFSATLFLLALIMVFELKIPTMRLLAAAGLSFGFYMAAAVYPAWSVARHNPNELIRERKIARIKIPGTAISSFSLGIYNLFRRVAHFGLTFVCNLVPTCLLGFFLSVLATIGNDLEGSLLGESIQMHISGHHIGMLLVIIAISVLTILQFTMLKFHERRHEIGLLKAIGWNNAEVTGMFVWEGFVLGILCAVAALVLLSASLTYFFGKLDWNIWKIILPVCLLPTILNLVAVVYVSGYFRRLSIAQTLQI